MRIVERIEIKLAGQQMYIKATSNKIITNAHFWYSPYCSISFVRERLGGIKLAMNENVIDCDLFARKVYVKAEPRFYCRENNV